jgi:hypothetical protein
MRRPDNRVIGGCLPDSFGHADEDTVFEEAMDNLEEAGQRVKATKNLICSQGVTEGDNYRDLLTCLSTAAQKCGR